MPGARLDEAGSAKAGGRLKPDKAAQRNANIGSKRFIV
jgi:hypothetical protein